MLGLFVIPALRIHGAAPHGELRCRYGNHVARLRVARADERVSCTLGRTPIGRAVEAGWMVARAIEQRERESETPVPRYPSSESCYFFRR
ncbi:MAG TPA: hypothetical protein VGY54_19115, partial [Polyangiaceae bacterium]|nr:hypothetical protein [Polyangiaceae bacterium]